MVVYDKNAKRKSISSRKSRKRMSLLSKDVNISYHLNLSNENIFQTPTQKDNLSVPQNNPNLNLGKFFVLNTKFFNFNK